MTAATAPRLRVLHVVHSGGLYGIERMLLALVPALEAQGVDAALACFGGPETSGGAVGALAQASGARVFFLGDDPEATWDGARAYWRTLRAWRPHLMHYHGYRATIVGGVIAGVLRVPGMATYHAEAGRTVGLEKQLAVETPILRRLRHVVAVSPAIRAELRSRGVAESRCSVIANGIADPPVRRQRQDGRFNIAVVGRLVPGKNVHLVFEAAAALRRDVPGLQVTVAGDGPERQALESRAAALGISDAVRFLGFINDVPAMLQTADVLAMPSDTEGLPISILEALAVGVPIVASAVGSIPDVARDGRESWLMPAGDGTALASLLRAVAADPSAADRRAAAGRQRFEQEFTAGAMAAQYETRYRSLQLLGNRD